MHKLIEYVCDELTEIEKKAEKSGDLTAAEVEYADKLAHLKKNLLKGEEMYDEMYSGDDRMMSGNRPYRMDIRGSYARGDGRGRGSRAKRDSMGRYSSERGYSRDADDLVEKLHDLMEDAPDEKIRHEIKRLADKVDSMM